MAETIIVKDVRSPERLLDETALFLHRVQTDQQPKREMLEQLYQTDATLAGKKVLIVDDDMRNIFALTSLLERHKMQVVFAENGRQGIATLQDTPGINIVLMDVMMPEMDGYETMQAIRNMPQFAPANDCSDCESYEGRSGKMYRSWGVLITLPNLWIRNSCSRCCVFGFIDNGSQLSVSWQ